MRQSYFVLTRHAAFVLFLIGVPFFALALADPFTAFTRQEASYPGRRIAGDDRCLHQHDVAVRYGGAGCQGKAGYFTSVAAAEYFMKMRMQGPNHDLISLIEFGSEAYVVTPFTTDYQNILLSTKLIGDWDEWQRFPIKARSSCKPSTGLAVCSRPSTFSKHREPHGDLSDGEDSQPC